jgi:hypothetical protein
MEQILYLPAADPSRETTVLDGYVVDSDTGEVLGFVDPPQGKSDFAVVDVPSAEWVMRKLLEADSIIKAIDQSADVQLARSILANADSLKAPHEKKIEWLQTCFGPALESVAKENLPKKGKTWQTLYGSIAFRSIKPKLEIRAVDRASAWLAKHFPSCIRVVAELEALSPDDRTYIASLAEESAEGIKSEIMKLKIPAEVQVRAASEENFEVETGIAYIPERESATLTIGAKASKKSKEDDSE